MPFLWFLRGLCFLALLGQASAFDKVEAAILENQRAVEFIMERPQIGHSVFGISALLECPSCDEGSYVDVEIFASDEAETARSVLKYRAYFRGQKVKNFYNLLALKSGSMIYENNDEALRIDPQFRYFAQLQSSAPVTYFVEQPPVGPETEWWQKNRPEAQSTLTVKWMAQPHTGTSFGIPLHSLGQPNSEFWTYVLANLILGATVTLLMWLALRRRLVTAEGRKILTVALLGTAVTFLLYFVTLCIDHPGGDSREFQFAQLRFRELHQPGDPILAIVAALFGKYFPVASFIYKAHLLAAMLSSMAIGLLAAGLYIFTGIAFAAILPAFVLATSLGFWNYAVVAQNYSMSSFFQASMLFFAFNVRRWPNQINFMLACLAAFVMVTTHPTNGYWVFFCALVILPELRFVQNKFKTLVQTAAITAGAIALLYLPYLLFVESPGYFRPVLVYFNEAHQLVKRGPDAQYIAFSLEGFKSFLRYVMGNSENQSWTGGIASILVSKSIFTILLSEWRTSLQVLIFGFGGLAMLLGGFGLFRMMQENSTRLLGLGILLSLLMNLVLLVCEILYFRVGYVEIFVVHAFPAFFLLTISMVALFKFPAFQVFRAKSTEAHS